ncbi:MAG: DNA helicase RecQ [Clostridium sp.]|nr:DNA helicase RecQ [Clostridium sp.]
MEKCIEVLNKYYGYKSFREGQKEIIEEILKGRDVLAIMPTGAGKSICYQVPALIFEGMTIVISPLISLMKDQVDSLISLGIEASFINSTLDKNELEDALYKVKNNKCKILYIAPERLDSIEFLNIVSNLNISQVAIDEAHCVSSWGHDFRISYRKIAFFINSLNTKPIVTAFTATASSEVREDIINLLKLKNPKVFVTGFDRKNLEITVVKGKNKTLFLNEYLKKNKDASGIIYCATRKETDKIYNDLLKDGYKVLEYHAGLSDEVRKRNQEDFINDKVNIMVATNAFGMGIDKPNIRYVIHNNMPQNIEGYYQEIGRAGRDGEKSECILLFSPSDIHLQKYLIDISIESEERKAVAYSKLQDMTSFVYSSGCYRKFILNYFGEEVKEDCNNCSNCLAEGEIIDKTIDAQKVLCCIKRMNRGYGIGMLVNVLRGSKDKKVVGFGFDKLSTYGIMKDYSKEDLTTFINTLISHGFISQEEGTYPILKLNNRSVKVIKGQEKVELKEIVVKENKYEVNELFNILRNLRMEISREENVPPYIVFGDNTLKEMSNTYPINKEKFLMINGVGQLKYEKYGERFLEVIRNYVKENNIVIEEANSFEKKEEAKKEILNVNTDNKLYSELRNLRKKFAEREGVYEYSTISMNTLKEISGRYPKTLEELKDISGMGPKKCEKYSKEILELVNKYIKYNNINANFKYKERNKVIIDGETRSNNEICIDEIKKGTSLKEISKNIELSISTLLGYVTDYIKETGEVDFNLGLDEFIKPLEKERIISVCNKVGIEKVSLIKKELPREISYDSIRAVILKNYYKIN